MFLDVFLRPPKLTIRASFGSASEVPHFVLDMILLSVLHCVAIDVTCFPCIGVLVCRDVAHHVSVAFNISYVSC